MRRQIIINCAISLVLFGLASLIVQLPLFESLERQSIDLRFQLRPRISAAKELVILEIDDATISDYGMYPIPRGQIALMIHELCNGGAHVIGVDLLFEGRDNLDPANDTLMWVVSAACSSLVHSVDIPFYAPDGDGSQQWSAEKLRHAVERPVEQTMAHLFVADQKTAALPSPELWKGAYTFGNIAVLTDRDNVVRKTPLIVRMGEQIMPSFALEVLRLWSGGPNSGKFYWRSGTLVVSGDRASMSIPVDSKCQSWINYTGSTERFNRVSFIEIMRSLRGENGAERSAALEAVAGRVVLIGVASVLAEYQDLGPTPHGNLEPRVYTHANLISNALTGEYLRDPPRGVPVLSILLLAFAIAVSVSILRPLSRFLLLMGIALCFILYADLAFRLAGMVVPVVCGLVGAGLSTAVFFGMDYVREQKAKWQLIAERRAAAEIQRRLLPSGNPDLPGYDIACQYIPSREVSGDYYDFFRLDEDRLVIAIADVSGKGIGAALIMSNLQAILRSEMTHDRPLNETIDVINRRLSEELSEGRFVTGFFSVLNEKTGHFEYVNAGHNPPAHISESGDLNSLIEGDLILGFASDTSYKLGSVKLQIGDVLALYTDGVSESVSPRGEEFGDARLIALIRDYRHLPAVDVVKKTLDEIHRFERGAPPRDDLSIVVIKRTG